MQLRTTPEHATVLYARLTVAAVAFVVCGSLAPFRFELVPIGDMFQRFRDALALYAGIGSRSDVVANVLLMIPVAFCAAGALRPASTRGSAAAQVLGIALGGCALSLSLEFMQAFVPARVVSLEDVASETFGSLLGALAFAWGGHALTTRVQRSALGRHPLSAAERLLLGYVVLLLLWQLMPLDLSLEPAEVFHKYRDGLLVTGLPLSPGELFATPLSWGLASLYIPVGAGAALLWRRRGYRRAVPLAMFLALSTVTAIQLSHVFVESRSVDVQELFLGAVGAAAGVAAVTWFSRDVPVAGIPNAFGPAVACLAWAAAIVAVKLYPFNFVADGREVLTRVQRLASLSSLGANRGSTLAMTATFLMALPLGVFARRAVGRESRVSAIAVGCFVIAVAALWSGVELGVALLPSGDPMFAQVPVAVCGAAAGLLLGGLELRAVTLERLR